MGFRIGKYYFGFTRTWYTAYAWDFGSLFLPPINPIQTMVRICFWKFNFSVTWADVNFKGPSEADLKKWDKVMKRIFKSKQ